MNIGEIVILKSTNPIVVQDQPSPETIDFLAKSVQDPTFELFITSLRSNANIPDHKFDITPFIGKNLSEIPLINHPAILPALRAQLNLLTKELGLSNDFTDNLLLLTLFNAIIDVKLLKGFISSPIQFIFGRQKISSALWDYPHEVGALIVPFDISQNKLVTWIEENWKSIDENLNKTLTVDPYQLTQHKNTIIALEIMELRDKQNLSFKEISVKLTDKYPKDKRFTDEIWIRQVYGDYQYILNHMAEQVKQKK